MEPGLRSTAMDAEEARLRAGSFGSVARQYAEHRPGYPAEAVSWLAGSQPTRVLELGSGTGKLTQPLVALGHDVVATDLSPGMLGQLPSVAPKARPVAARAEAIPLRSGIVDVVASAQAFHWFDAELAVPEIARVLRPDGVLALVWNIADVKVPWVRKVLALIEMNEEDFEEPLADSEVFEVRERKVFRHWQRFDRESLIGYISSNSYSAVLAPDRRDDLLAEVGALYDSYGRGHDGMMFPWNALCYRAGVTKAAAAQVVPPPPDDGLLIDFS